MRQRRWSRIVSESARVPMGALVRLVCRPSWYTGNALREPAPAYACLYLSISAHSASPAPLSVTCPPTDSRISYSGPRASPAIDRSSLVPTWRCMTPLAPQREIRSPGASLFPRTVTLQRPPGRPCPMAPCPGLADGPMGHIRWLPSHDPLGMAVSRRALKHRLPTPLTDRRGISPGPRVARPWPVNHQGHSVKAAAAFALHAPRQAAAREGRSSSQYAFACGVSPS